MRSSILAPRPGFEPGTHGLEGRCSIHLSYRGLHFKERGGLLESAQPALSPLFSPYMFRITMCTASFSSVPLQDLFVLLICDALLTLLL